MKLRSLMLIVSLLFVQSLFATWSGWREVPGGFVTHETREAVTDPLGNAWYDSSGNEADDKCAWTSLFLENGYGYQPEWSNAIGGCKQ